MNLRLQIYRISFILVKLKLVNNQVKPLQEMFGNKILPKKLPNLVFVRNDPNANE